MNERNTLIDMKVEEWLLFLQHELHNIHGYVTS